jgi:hypothetical protein
LGNQNPGSLNAAANPGSREAPTGITAAPNADGSVTLKWQGSTAHRTHFTVWRKRATDPQWSMVGSCSRKSFIDDMVPAPGSNSGGAPMTLLYQVRAQRGSFISMPSMTVTITYGSDGAAIAGTIGASVAGEDELSIAA